MTDTRAAPARCFVCGGAIELAPYEVPPGVMARGDRLMHEGCVLVPTASQDGRTEVPAYHLPVAW